jgi:hypothetical protein
MSHKARRTVATLPASQSSPTEPGGGAAFVQKALQKQLAEIELSTIIQNKLHRPCGLQFRQGDDPR